jgi:hypothetical protein
VDAPTRALVNPNQRYGGPTSRARPTRGGRRPPRGGRRPPSRAVVKPKPRGGRRPPSRAVVKPKPRGGQSPPSRAVVKPKPRGGRSPTSRALVKPKPRGGRRPPTRALVTTNQIVKPEMKTMATAGSSVAQACPYEKCSGLFQGYFLPSEDTFKVMTGGVELFKDTKIGACVSVKKMSVAVRTFKNVDSMEEFNRYRANEVDVSGSVSSVALSFTASVATSTSSSSSLQSRFHSSMMDIKMPSHSIDVNSKCYNTKLNWREEFLRGIDSLPLIAQKDVHIVANWVKYKDFLKTHGSHIMTHQTLGSRFQKFESSTSSATSSSHELEVKICAELEGTTKSVGWSVKGCAKYSESESKKAESKVSKGETYIRGGTVESKNALIKEVSKKTLDGFIDSAHLGHEAIGYKFKPIWLLLKNLYKDCKKGSKDCERYQKAVTLQATYEGESMFCCLYF